MPEVSQIVTIEQACEAQSLGLLKVPAFLFYRQHKQKE